MSFIDVLPPLFKSHVTGTKNVDGDGHCGFRAIADLLDFGEEAWSRVRRDLMAELDEYTEMYEKVFVESGHVGAAMKVLDWFEDHAPHDHWFCLPEMGHLIASAYNVVMVVLSPELSLTYLPLRTDIGRSPKVICIGLINSNHFIQVSLHSMCIVHTSLRRYQQNIDVFNTSFRCF